MTQIHYTERQITCVMNEDIQKSVHRPFLSQSPKRVGSANDPPLRGPPHSFRVPCPNIGSATTNISSCSSSSSLFSSSGIPCEQLLPLLLLLLLSVLFDLDDDDDDDDDAVSNET